MSNWSVSTANTTEIISLAAAKNFLRVDSDITVDDTLITLLIDTAKNYVESYINSYLLDTVIEEKFEGFGTHLYLSVPLSHSITSVVYIDQDGSSQTLATNQYQLTLSNKIGTIYPEKDVTWPDTHGNKQDVTVTYTVGYGSAVSSIPDVIIQAMYLMIGTWYSKREDTVRKMPTAVDNLLSQQRLSYL